MQWTVFFIHDMVIPPSGLCRRNWPFWKGRNLLWLIDIVGDGTPEQFEMLREQPILHSPNALAVMQGG